MDEANVCSKCKEPASAWKKCQFEACDNEATIEIYESETGQAILICEECDKALKWVDRLEK